MGRQSPEEKAKFLAHVHQPAKLGQFQYLYDNIPVYDAWHRRRGQRALLDEFFEFINGEAFLSLAGAITGAEDIGFADAQATRYRPGHFLTMHDDRVETKDRRAAYVVNLTRLWGPDWGGLTLFMDADGHIEEAFTPRFNALNIFRVPQPHSVSLVAPFAGQNRYAITGWCRAGKDPGV
jgi:Rps23 Pro-64 3,4-dihydroxylase Tpa1-like proline 4-hydroxylase